MNITAILQARMSSTRLPNKVLNNILGKPMLLHQIERLSRCKRFNKLVVATSNKEEDKAIVELCKQHNVSVYAGSLDNVLDRYYQAALKENADIIVRLTGDCPLADADIIDATIQLHLESNSDYTSNVEPATFPDGLDVEVFSFRQLEQAWKHAVKSSDLEHVTPYIRNVTAKTKANYYSSHDYSHHRWTVDEPEDFILVEKVYQYLGAQGQYFNTQEIYHLLEKHPQLIQLNSNIKRNEGYIESPTKKRKNDE